MTARIPAYPSKTHRFDGDMPKWLVKFIKNRQETQDQSRRVISAKKEETKARRHSLVVDFLTLTQRRDNPLLPGAAIDVLMRKYDYTFPSIVRYLEDARVFGGKVFGKRK